MFSIHGLIRGHDLELGRDADTGGQTTYVVELARALAKCERVEEVALLTRLVVDCSVSDDYAQPSESLCEGASIVRIEAGPAEYIYKEALWDCLDAFVDNTLEYFMKRGRIPDVLHSHYADAGYVGSRIAKALGVPLVHTGHSLGRIKRTRLLAFGLSAEEIEERFNMSRRVEAEELTLATAERVITSTTQEIEEQYEHYDYYQPDQMVVIPPGIDLQRFQPPQGDEWSSPVAQQVGRFLREPERPMVLAIARADARKNLAALVRAFGSNAALHEHVNLVVVAGNRDDLNDLEDDAQAVLTDILAQIDRFDLYGTVAYPKHHQSDDVPVLYRLAASTGGVFVNPALTEPFGLTLLEAAASGLPIAATEDGGPRDIVANCRNGVLIDPLDEDDIARGILEILGDWETWQERSLNGLRGVREHYSWEAHAAAYLDVLEPIVQRTAAPLLRPLLTRRQGLYRERAIFSDLDQSLLASRDGLPEFVQMIRARRRQTLFGIVTGRSMESALAVMKSYAIPEPDVLITSGGTRIHYAPSLTEDEHWVKHIERHWTPAVVRRVLSDVPGLLRQPRKEQGPFKISYYIDPNKAPDLAELQQLLHKEEQSVNLVLSFGQFLDVLPERASKGLALRYVAARWQIPLERILVAGGSGADEDMMRGNTLGVVVRNRHHEELSDLEALGGVYFAKANGAAGIMEAVDHFDLFDEHDAGSDEREEV